MPPENAAQSTPRFPVGRVERAWAIDDVLDAALDVPGAEIAEIFLRERDSAGVSFAGFRGPFEEAFKQITRFEEGQGYPGRVTFEGRPLKATDVVHDARFLRTQVKDLGFCCFLCVPIPGPERAIGSLDVASRSNCEPLSHCLTLSRDAERLGLILEREDDPLRRMSEAQEADANATRLNLRFLGSLEARRGSVPLRIDAFARRRAVTLLKILVTNYGKVVPRDELIELLWPSDPPKDAANLLKIAVHYLRRGLGQTECAKSETPFISTEPNGYAFNPASFHWLDARAFETKAEEGFHFERQGRWREALLALQSASELYTGDYLEDDLYSDWCALRRNHLRDIYFEVLLTTARLLRGAGDHEAAIRPYRRLLELDPCLEDVHRDLMEALCRCGRRTEALRQFEACRRALKEEFDVAPVIETETLYRSILGQRGA